MAGHIASTVTNAGAQLSCLSSPGPQPWEGMVLLEFRIDLPTNLPNLEAPSKMYSKACLLGDAGTVQLTADAT